MHLLQTQTADHLRFPSSPIGSAPLFGRMARFFRTILRLRKVAQTHVVPGYEGYGWCDSSERQLNFDLVACRRSWIF